MSKLQTPVGVQTIEIHEAPPSINTFYGHTGKRRYVTKKGREFKEYIEWYLHKLKMEGRICDYSGFRLRIDYEFHFKGKRPRDTSNYIKVAEDCLSGILFDDDEQVDEVRAKRFYHAPENKVIITITNLGSKKPPRVPQDSV